jgi:chemotaxis protein methyltransferase CheR
MKLSPENFLYLVEWAKLKSGILLEGKEIMVDARLDPIAVETKCSGPNELVENIKKNPTAPLSVKILEALTTNETFWFRDHHPFEILREKILPECLQERKLVKTFRLWSAACSMGQEPYSISMLLKHHFPQLDHWKVNILATDLSEKMIAKSSAGKYDQAEINRGLPTLFLAKYFDQDGILWKVKDEVRKCIEFRSLNLTHDFTLPQDLDVIFIRNVLIYFDIPTKRKILLRAIQYLRKGGYLILGSAESLYGLEIPVESVMNNKVVYYRKT